MNLCIGRMLLERDEPLAGNMLLAKQVSAAAATGVEETDVADTDEAETDVAETGVEEVPKVKDLAELLKGTGRADRVRELTPENQTALRNLLEAKHPGPPLEPSVQEWKAERLEELDDPNRVDWWRKSLKKEIQSTRYWYKGDLEKRVKMMEFICSQEGRKLLKQVADAEASEYTLPTWLEPVEFKKKQEWCKNRLEAEMDDRAAWRRQWLREAIESKWNWLTEEQVNAMEFIYSPIGQRLLNEVASAAWEEFDKKARSDRGKVNFQKGKLLRWPTEVEGLVKSFLHCISQEAN